MIKIIRNNRKIYNPFLKSYQNTAKYYSKNNGEKEPPAQTSKKICKGKTLPIVELGQPTYWTHPHLFTTSNASDFSKQVTPGITKKEFEQRRTNYVEHLISYQAYYFSSKLSKTEKAGLTKKNATINNLDKINHNFIAVIPSAQTTFMAPDVMHNFKQNSDFLYLTGFREPDSVLVISRTDTDVSTNSYKTALFVKEKNAKKELWDGAVTGPDLVSKLTGIPLGYPLKEFKNYLDSLIRETNSNKKLTLWRYPTDYVKQESGPNCRIDKIEEDLDKFIEENTQSNNKLIDMIEQDPINASHAASYFNTSRYFVQLCRVKKSKAELEIMRQACDISSDAFKNTMQIAHPFINEHLIFSKFDYDCRIRGSEYLAYIPVIAGGSRATVLHYIRNNQIISNDSMVLMDAGCQYRDYASDITRTWPVGGRFKNAQKDLYEACLNVQKYCLKKVTPGLSIQQIYYIMMRKMSEELSNIGLINKKDHDEAIKSTDSPTDSIPMAHLQKLVKYCPHDVGHYLGLDVHDCPEISKHAALESGCVITIEPGIYIKSNDESVPAKYRGIGIRIEDDVAITDTGCDILSKNCPKEISDIEKIIFK